MVLPIRYPDPAPSVLLNVNLTDVVQSTGIVKFTGYSSTVSTSTLDYHLTTDEGIYSSTIETTASALDNASVDIDFDLPAFNKPVTIEGGATVNFTVYGDAGVGMTTYHKGTVYIRKWDGSTETTIVSAISERITLAGGASSGNLMTVPLTVPRTHFKKGDILRLTIVAQIDKVTNSDTVVVTLGHDPLNRDGTNIVPSTDDPDTITKCIFYCPFDISQ